MIWKTCNLIKIDYRFKVDLRNYFRKSFYFILIFLQLGLLNFKTYTEFYYKERYNDRKQMWPAYLNYLVERWRIDSRFFQDK